MPLLVIYSRVGELRAFVLLLLVVVALLHFSNPPRAVFLTIAISQNIITINVSLFGRDKKQIKCFTILSALSPCRF